jgi:Recombination endonuclease VII
MPENIDSELLSPSRVAVTEQTEKRCTKCRIYKPPGNFGDRPGNRTRCLDCRKEYDRQRHQKNRDIRDQQRKQRYEKNKKLILEQQKQYYRKNRERALQQRKQYYENNRGYIAERRRFLHIKTAYGISEPQFNILIEKQKNRCPVCLRSFDEVKKICVDHCHNAGHVRGLLCGNCNTAEGLLRTIEDAKRMVKYKEANALFYPSDVSPGLRTELENNLSPTKALLEGSTSLRSCVTD